MSPLSFVPLGVGDAFSDRYYSSCYAVEAGDRWVLVDCPHPIRKMMREAEPTAGVTLDVDRIEGLILTHLHADHVSGLEGFAYFSFFVLGRKVKLHAHPDVLARLWDGHLSAGMERLVSSDGHPRAMGLHDYFDVTPLDAGGRVPAGPFEVECRLTRHHVPTTALRLHASGRCLGLSADTNFDPGLLEWLAPADLIVHETNYGIHTPYERLAELPEATRAKMRLVHYPDSFDLSASVIAPLIQGRRYEL